MQGLRRPGRERQDVEAPAGFARPCRGSLLALPCRPRLIEDDVGIGATDAEGADARAEGPPLHLPGAELRVHEEGGAVQVDLGVQLGKVRGGRDGSAPQHLQHLDKSGGSGRAVGVRNVALHGAEGDAGLAGTPLAAELREGVHEPPDFDAVAHAGARAVALDVGERPRVLAHHPHRPHDRHALAHRRGCGVAGLLPAIVRHGEAAHRAPNQAARLVPAAEHQRGHRIAKDGAVGLFVERPDIAVDGVHQAVLVQEAQVREGDRRGPRHGCVALAGRDGRCRLHARHEGGGTGRVHVHGGAGEVKQVGDTCGNVVLLVTNLCQEDVLRVHGILQWHAIEVVHQVPVNARGRKDTNHSIREARAGRDRCVLQGSPSGLHEDTVLRIHDGGLVPTNAEEGIIKFVSVVDLVRAGDKVLVVDGRLRDSLASQEVLGEEGGRDRATLQILPERVHIVCAGEAARDADNGDAVGGCRCAAAWHAAGLDDRGACCCSILRVNEIKEGPQ
mmetsp:Transcript_85991/g.256489  ORF Transcript_85991/g.256489 Transcript_85991/m.256489 type:complete len:503 (-) Transcript_85991:111-1619(-)